MSKALKLLAIVVLVLISLSAQAQTRSLSDWIGKTPLVPNVTPRQGVYTSPEIRPTLIALLGQKYYRRLVNDYYVMAPIELIDGYLVAQMCRQHFCSQDASFMAVNLTSGDIHVAFWHSGTIEWFHTTGMAKDLPNNVLHRPWWLNSTPVKVREVTRSSI